MKKFLITSAIAFCINIPAHASLYPVNLDGDYNCNGTEVGSNEKYTCNMKVKKTGETYSATSTCNDGSSYIGTGIYNKTNHNFSLVFINPKKSEETGIAIAEIRKDYSMSSTWTYLNKTSVGHCACVKKHNALNAI